MKFLRFFIPIAHFLTLSLWTQAQEIFQPSSRSQAMAEIYTALTGGWAIFGNQAGMADAHSVVVGVSFQNRFLVPELSAGAVFAVVPVKSSVFALSFYQFGKVPFRNGKMGFAYARTFGDRLSLGAQFNYFTVYLPEENQSAGTAGLEVGAQYLLNKKLTVGLHVCNPYAAKIHLYSGNFNYATVIATGALYQLSDDFSFSGEVECRAGDLRIKSGFEYSVGRMVFIRGGISGKPYKISGGTGFCLGPLTVDLAASYHQNLGSSPSVSLQYQF